MKRKLEFRIIHLLASQRRIATSWKIWCKNAIYSHSKCFYLNPIEEEAKNAKREISRRETAPRHQFDLLWRKVCISHPTNSVRTVSVFC